jgi:tetratricopeptide (TPR) repeat protein
MKLSVFRGGFTSRAAQTVTGASLRVLAALVNKALLTRDAEGRCTVHELLRQYAAEQLDSSDQAFTVRDAHSAYYLEALRQRKSDLEGHNQIVTLKDIEIDLENIQAAWAWAVAQGHYAALGGAVQPLWLFHFMRGRYVDGEHFFAEAAETLRRAPADESRNNVLGDVLARQAHFASHTFQAAKRDQLMTESQTLTDLSGAPAAQAFRLLSANWTLAWEWRDTPASVEPALEEALGLFRELGCRWEMAFTLLQLGGANWGFVKAPNPTRALHYLEKARAIFTDMGDLLGLAYTLNNIGVVNGTFLRNHEEAVRVLREGVTLRRRLGTRAGIANSLGNLALQLAVPGQLAEAEQCLQECLTLKRELGNPQDALGFEDLGEILVRQGRFAEAWPVFEEGLSRVEDTTQYVWINIYLLWLARLNWLEGHYQAASARLEDWLTRNAAADEPGQQHDMVFALVLGGYVALAQGNRVEASAYCDRAARFAQERHDPWGQAACQVVTGQLAYLEGDFPAARAGLEAVLHYFQSDYITDMSLGWEEVFPISRALVTLSRVACAEGDFTAARGYVRELLRHARQYAIDSFALTALVAMAELLAAQSQLERAAEMAALVQTHPHTYAIDRDAATRVLEMLESEVDQTVHERGKALDVQAVVIALLEELEPSGKS